MKLYDAYDQIVTLLNESMPDAVEAFDADTEELARLLKRHDDLTAAMQIARQLIVDKLVDRVPFDGLPVQGVGTLEVKGGKLRKRFDQPRVVSSIARAASERLEVDPETGETLPIPEVVERVCTLMAEATGALAPSFDSWRVTVLRKLDINPSKFCDEERASKTIIIRGAS